jgi:hypothetical protein
MLCKIWGSHGGDYEEYRLLWCYALWLLWELTFRRKAHGVTSQKTAFFNLNPVLLPPNRELRGTPEHTVNYSVFEPWTPEDGFKWWPLHLSCRVLPGTLPCSTVPFLIPQHCLTRFHKIFHRPQTTPPPSRRPFSSHTRPALGHHGLRDSTWLQPILPIHRRITSDGSGWAGLGCGSN